MVQGCGLGLVMGRVLGQMAKMVGRALGVMIGLAAGLGVLSDGSAQAVTPLSHDWALRINEGRVSDAVLSYEVANTDDQVLAFVCEEGGGRIFATKTGGAPSLWLLVLEVGQQKFTVGGKSVATEIPEMPVFTSVEIAAQNPIFDHFAATGAMMLTAGSQKRLMSASAKAKPNIARFVQFCRG